MAKAINDGTCQICGCRQRLPNGRLAKHGYTTRWGFFSGTCTGSGELPFEQSVGLILNAIDRAKAEAAGLLDNAADQKLQAQSTESRKTMHSCYLPATWTDRKSRHEWREVDIIEEGGRFLCRFASRDQNGREITQTANLYGTLASIVKAGREGYAHYLTERSKKYAEYARWQESRIANWKPAPLLERLGGR
jgi:hypothetical protein